MNKIGFVFLLGILISGTFAQHGGGNQAEKDCYKGLDDLVETFSEISSGINNKQDLEQLRAKVLMYIQQVPTVALKCYSIIDYDFTKQVEGTMPNLNKITDCKSGYIEFLDQIKRVVNAYYNNKMEQLNEAASQLKPIADKIAEKCQVPYP